jgi:hypothetical protein
MSQHRQLKAARERALRERREQKREKKEAARLAKERDHQPAEGVAVTTPERLFP